MSPPLVLPVTAADVTASTWTTGTAQTVPVPSGLVTGDTVTILAYDQVAASTITATGFTAQYHATTTGTRGFYVFTKKVTNAATDLAGSTYAITLGSSGRGCAIAVRSPILSATPIDAAPGSDAYSAVAGTTVAVPGITVGHADAAVLLCWFGNGTSSVVATGTATGYTVVKQTSVDNAGSTSSIGILQGNPGSGATGTVTVTMSNSMASSGGFAISLLPSPALTGIASSEAFGTTTVSKAGGVSLTGIASAEAFGTTAVTKGLSAVQTLLALPVPLVAHRDGCWGTYGEETLAGYAFAAAWNPTIAFEVSVWKTTDGVWVCSHDQTTGRVFSGTSLDITTSTWASLSAKTTLVGGNPIARLDVLLAAQATGTRAFMIDDKGQQSTSTLLDLLDTYGGKDRFIAKGYINSTAWADAASGRGYTTWGYGFQADVTGPGSVIGATPNNYSNNQSHWTMLSMDEAAATAAWTYALSFGKVIISDELSTATQKTHALSLGATGIMSSDITVTSPQIMSITTTGLASSEAFGTTAVSEGVKPVILPPGIPSAESFGSLLITPAGIIPTGITTGEDFGRATVSEASSTLAVWLFTPPMWSNPVTLGGRLVGGILTSTIVYRVGGVWFNIQDAGIDQPDLDLVDVEPRTGLRCFFTKAVVVPDELHAGLAALTAASDSWTQPTLTQL